MISTWRSVISTPYFLYRLFGFKLCLTDRRGVTAIEYGLIAAIIISAIALAFPFVATGVGGLLTKVATSFPASAAAT